jgi:1-acyl-sn-glycerol-3-phosphate acyltransferase
MTESTAERSSRARLLWQVPFSAYVWTSAFGVMLGSSLVSVLTRPFRTPVEQSLWSAKAFARVLELSRSDVRVHYDEAFDRERSSLFCFNHVNLLDAHTACRTIPQPFVGLMLAWHFKVPGYGWMMKATHGIPVHPRAAGRTDELIAEAQDRVAKGLSILAFPEGHRTRDGRVGPYKRGMFFLARSTGVPIVPVAVRGMYEINRKGSSLFSPGEVSVYVGPQIEASELDDEEVGQLAAAVQRAVADYVEGRDREGAGLAALEGWSPSAAPMP